MKLLLRVFASARSSHLTARLRCRKRAVGGLVAVGLIAGLIGSVRGAPAQKRSSTGKDAPRVTHGVAVGEVTATSAVVWARGSRVKIHKVDGAVVYQETLSPQR